MTEILAVAQVPHANQSAHGPEEAPALDAALSRELRRPWAPQDVRFKVQSQNQAGAEVVAYQDVRAVMARLNLLCAGAWSETTEPLPASYFRTMVADGREVMALADRFGRLRPVTSVWYRCRLTIFGVTHEESGEGDDPKAAFSDSLKRAAVRFGIGECLYAFSLPRLQVGGPETAPTKETLAWAGWAGATPADLILPLSGSQGKERPEITAGARRALRALYGRWLAQDGERAFGKALSHGPGEGVPANGFEERLAAAAAKLDGESDGALVHALAVLLRADGSGEVALDEELVAEMCTVLQSAAESGWAAPALGAEVRRHLDMRSAPQERREAFLTRIKRPVQKAA